MKFVGTMVYDELSFTNFKQHLSRDVIQFSVIVETSIESL